MTPPGPAPERAGSRPAGSRPRHLLAAASILLACASAVLAHVRLIHPSSGSALRWSSPGNIGVVIQSNGSDNLVAGEHLPALRSAIRSWNDVSGTTAALVENTNPSQMARTDWASDDIHMILFDEVNDSDFFPAGSGTVAITPVWFYSNGVIADADILFNGQGFNFTTSGQGGAFDVEDVGAHELGHLLGLDHSGWAGATMYPYVDPTVILHRSLARDDAHGLRDAYPAGSFASLGGSLERGAGSAVAGAHVVAVDSAGRTAGAALANAAGDFLIRGLDGGSYALYATPLDNPVTDANLGAGHTVETDFATTEFGIHGLSSGQSLNVGTLTVDPDVPLSLGRTSDRYPLRAPSGSTTPLQVRGSGLSNGASLTASDPSLTITVTNWMTSRVTFDVTVPAGALSGHVDLTVTKPGGGRSTLVAGLEITPPDPTVTQASPSSGDSGGGTVLTIAGSGFRAGARVVLGDQLYVDGDPVGAGGCMVLDDSTIMLTTAATAAGTWDVVVIDASGVEGRATNAFTSAAVPVVTSVFPAGGDSDGGTDVTLRGANFASGALVRVDGQYQGNVSVLDESTLTFTTEGGAPGGPYLLEVVNPGGALATSAFVYAAQADPQLVQVTPGAGSSQGGDVIQLLGFSLPANAQVTFGADPTTGAGGVSAASLTVLDARTLEVTTPSHAAGLAAVAVLDPLTGQASLLPGGFLFQGSAGGGGGGGGGCGAVLPERRDGGNGRDVLAGLAWILAAMGVALLHGRKANPGPSA